MSLTRSSEEELVDRLGVLLQQEDSRWNISGLSAELSPEFLTYYAENRWNSAEQTRESTLLKGAILLAIILKRRLPTSWEGPAKKVGWPVVYWVRCMLNGRVRSYKPLLRRSLPTSRSPNGPI